jgi:pyruvate dehydrogenase E2 component (dihydrolipoamide acetyltransferase)
MPDVVMPRLSDSMEEGTILQWLKQVGDEVAVGDELVEIETDKANMAYESDIAGTLTEILAEEGETLPIGTPIARVGDSDEGQSATSAGPVAAGDPPPPPVAKASSGAVPPTAPPADETSKATEAPPLRRLRRRSLNLRNK